MIPNHWIDYLEKHILLKNEELDLTVINEDNDLIDIPVIKRTVRTRRITAILTIGYKYVNTPPDLLMQTYTSPHTKKQIVNTKEFYNWMKHGWVIREFRLEKDEKILKSERSRMGVVLYQFKETIKAKENKEWKNKLTHWQDEWQQVQKIKVIDYQDRRKVVGIFREQLMSLSIEVDSLVQQEIENTLYPHLSWRMNKQLSYLDFLLSFYQLASTYENFDWKQVGATYYQMIGGSKKFDQYKEEFIRLTEKLLQKPLHLFGLTSLGTITPIFFTGEMEGSYAKYHYGNVHATTDLAVFTDQFNTGARVLWLVENRGVLTRIAYEQAFVQDTKSYILSLDGQLRSGHERLIKQLANSVKQVIIWTDVDQAGLVIADDVTKTVEPICHTVKWIIPPLQAVTTYEDFLYYYKHAIATKQTEQEQTIGEMEDWIKWISH